MTGSSVATGLLLALRFWLAIFERRRLAASVALACSGLIAVLQLLVSLFSVAVFEQVLPVGDVAMLAWLTAAAVGLHLAASALDVLRGRILVKAGLALGRRLECAAQAAVRVDKRRGIEALGDVDRITGFVTGGGSSTLLDALWLPVTLLGVLLIDPLLAFYSVGAALVLVRTAAASDARGRSAGVAVHELRRRRIASACGRPVGSDETAARVVGAPVSRSYFRQCGRLATLSSGARSAAKAVRLSLQAIGFGLGAFLVVCGTMTTGQLLAWSLISARLFGCLEAALVHWRGFASALQGYGRFAAGEPPRRRPSQISNSSILANAVRKASDQAPDSFLKYSSS